MHWCVPRDKFDYNVIKELEEQLKNCTLDKFIDALDVDKLMDALDEMTTTYSKEGESEPQINDDERMTDNDTPDCDGDCEHCEFNEQQPIKFDMQMHDPFIDTVIDYLDDKSEDEYDAVDHPFHYTSHGLETIDKIEAVIDGLPAKEAAMLANVLKYFDRAGLKDDAHQDLEKANNYAHRLVYGRWKHENN